MSKKVDAKTIGELDNLFHETLKTITHASGGGMVNVVHEYELTLPQVMALDLVARGPQTVSSLATVLRLTPGAVSRLVDRLVRKKFINREEGDSDRRRKTLSLTAIGKLVFDQLERARAGNFSIVMSELDSDLAAELKDVLGRVVEVLHSRMSIPDDSGPSGKIQPPPKSSPRKRER
jgi:DNA-binding MarR family transcriptional regulator